MIERVTPLPHSHCWTTPWFIDYTGHDFSASTQTEVDYMVLAGAGNYGYYAAAPADADIVAVTIQTMWGVKIASGHVYVDIFSRNADGASTKIIDNALDVTSADQGSGDHFWKAATFSHGNVVAAGNALVVKINPDSLMIHNASDNPRAGGWNPIVTVVGCWR